MSGSEAEVVVAPAAAKAAAAVASAKQAPVITQSPQDEARLKVLYSIMQSIENKLGGGEGVEGLYGSIKKGGMDRVLECLRAQCGLGSDSVLLDVGAGLGRPLMHALLVPGVAGGRGIEIDRIKVDKAEAFLRQAAGELERRGVAARLMPPPIECSAVENVGTLEGSTHAYSFWEGVPIEGKAAFGRLFAAAGSLRSVAVVQRAIRTCPLAYMADLGFGELELVGCFAVSMSGSGRSFTAYVFNKAHLPARLRAPAAAAAAAAQSVDSVETPALAAEAAAAAQAPSVGAAAAAEEAEGEVAQSLRAGVRGRRQRRPSARQAAAELAAAEEAAEVAGGHRNARAQRAQQRASAAWEAAMALAQQQQQQQAVSEPAVEASPRRPGRHGAAAPGAKLSSPAKGGVRKRASPAKPAAAEAAAAAKPRRTLPLPPSAAPAVAQPEAPAAQEPASPRRSPRQLPLPAAAPVAAEAAPPAPEPAAPLALSRRVGRSLSRPAAAPKPTAPPAAKLNSPARGGVQKRASPTKAAAAAAAVPEVHRSPRKLPLGGAAKGAAAPEGPLPLAAGRAGIRGAVIKLRSEPEAGAGKAPPAARQSVRRGLNGL
ncbi:hypothetical protein C2E20_7797 [Micractinium conductrix]|uniref:DOT1 domain-containing protein n=1 Tax=Micractinium conductrix TaxID=554055 RepID=A0A2P6V3G0_9CHLO|nr:hypothetical protein C2E20_7797 [Micractinium conductrix]|eukprot:PSC68631.1 hypothetical protein C2E20_7797 [Micractinium conductrix]